MQNPVNKTRKHGNIKVTRPLQFSAIYFPTNIPTDIPDVFPQFVNTRLKIATLLSDAMDENLKYECPLLNLKKLNAKEIFKEPLPHFFLVESFFLNNVKLVSLVKEFNIRNIPTVLWITTPLHSFKHCHNALPLFRFIFSTDHRNIDALKNLAAHSNVFYLPFGVQPRLYNPTVTNEKSNFAAYLPSTLLSGKKFTASQSAFLLAASKHHPVDIITSPKNPKDLMNVLKKYRVVVYDPLHKYNSTDVDSLLYQLLACGINVITSYSLELKQVFGNHLLYTQNLRETRILLEKLFQSSVYRDRLSLLGQRFIFSSNTYSHRIDTILDKVGHPELKQPKPGVSIICCTHMDTYMNNIFENFCRQTYDKKELIIVLNDPNMNKKAWEERAKSLSNVRIIQPTTQKTVGYCTNLAVEHANYDYIANFDHDDYYGNEYVRDSLNVFKYTDAGLIGKKTHYVYFEDNNTLALMLPGYTNKYVVNIDGSSLFFKKDIFNKVRFIDSLFADIQFSLDCWNSDIKVYSCDQFNHVYTRRASKENHAFKMNDSDFMRYCMKIVQTKDFLPYINV